MLDSNKVREMLTTEQVIQLCCELQGDDTYYYDNYTSECHESII